MHHLTSQKWALEEFFGETVQLKLRSKGFSGTSFIVPKWGSHFQLISFTLQFFSSASEKFSNLCEFTSISLSILLSSFPLTRSRQLRVRGHFLFLPTSWVPSLPGPISEYVLVPFGCELGEYCEYDYVPALWNKLFLRFDSGCCKWHLNSINFIQLRFKESRREKDF